MTCTSHIHPGGTVTEALRGVSLAIPAGSMIALAGPTGAGKTTIADIVVGLISPTAGQVTVGGRPLTRARSTTWRDSVALVPQDPFLFHDTVRANLLWAKPGASEERLWTVLVQAAAADVIARLPQGLDTVVGDRGLLAVRRRAPADRARARAAARPRVAGPR